MAVGLASGEAAKILDALGNPPPHSGSEHRVQPDTLSAAAAGATSTSPTLTESPTGSMKYDMADIEVASTTLTNARALRQYADALAGDNLIYLINFGADYSTVAGTFKVIFDTLGVFAIDLTP